MDAKRKRRFLVPMIASTTAALAAGGWAAVEYGGFELPLAAAEQADEAQQPDAAAAGIGAIASKSSTLDRLEAVWQAEGFAGGAAVADAGTTGEPKPDASASSSLPVDPFVNLASNTAPSADELPADDLPVDEAGIAAVIARGQQPRGGAIEAPADARLPVGNPLRDSGVPALDAEQQALAERFSGGRYGDANRVTPIRVEIGPESRIQPAAAEAVVSEADAAASESPSIESSLGNRYEPQPSSAPEPPVIQPRPRYAQASSEEKGIPSIAAAVVESDAGNPASASLPLVDVPIVPPTAPSVEPPVSNEPLNQDTAPTLPAAALGQDGPAGADLTAPRVASQQPAYASAAPNRFDPVTPLAPINAANGFAQSRPTTPAAPRPGDVSLEGRQQPSLAVQKFAPESVQVGKPCRFLVKVRNDSPRALADVVVNDHTPAGARLVSTRPTAQTSGDQVRWLIGTLGPGEERTLEMEILPTEEGEIGSVATVSFAAQASAKTSVTRPLLALRLSAPAQVLVGQEQRMQIEVRNPGTGDATGVVLSEEVPVNLRHEAGSSVEFEIGTLRPGETRRLELVMNAEAAGPVSNVLTARADGDLEVQQQVDFEVVAPELTVAVSGPKRRFLERPATYTVRVDNPGTASARDIRLVARLPRGMRFVKANNLGEYDQATHSVYWALAELPRGEGGEVQVTALPTRAGEMTIEAEGQAGSGLRDQSVQQVKVEGIAAVDFRVLDVEDPIEVGGETEYEVRVDNQGTADATGVRVRFVAPAGMRVLSANGPTRHTIDAGGVTFDPLPRLAPRGENRYRVRVQAETAGDQRMMVEVTTDDLSQPVRKEEATRVFGDE